MSSKDKNVDQEIIARIRAGNREAIKYAYEKCYQPVQRMIEDNSGSQEDAEDIYQQAWIVIINKMNAGQLNYENLNLFGLIYKICWHKWMDELRKRKKRPKVDIENIALTELEEEIVDDSLIVLLLKVMKGELKDKCRLILHYYYFQKMKMAQIAEKMGYSDHKTMKVIKNRCMNDLRAIFKRKIDEGNE